MLKVEGVVGLQSVRLDTFVLEYDGCEAVAFHLVGRGSSGEIETIGTGFRPLMIGQTVVLLFSIVSEGRT